MPLNTRQRQHLKARAHKLRPVVLVGNAGVTEALVRELEQALEHHELLKIRLPGVEREKRTELLRQVCDQVRAEAVQEIGRVAVIYRPAQKPRLVIPED